MPDVPKLQFKLTKKYARARTILSTVLIDRARGIILLGGSTTEDLFLMESLRLLSLLTIGLFFGDLMDIDLNFS